MAKYREKIERIFYELSLKIYDNRLKALIIHIICIAALFSFFPKLEIDMSTEGFFLKTDKPLIEYNKFRDQFGRDEIVIVAVKPPDIFNPEFLQELKTMHEDFERSVPHLEDITSLINVRNTRGDGDTLIVEGLLDNWPVTKGEYENLKKRVLGNSFYQNNIISEDGRVTTLIIESRRDSSIEDNSFMEEFYEEPGRKETGQKKDKKVYLTAGENSDFVTAIEKIVRKYRSNGLEIYAAGSPLVNHHLAVTVGKESGFFILLVLLCLSVFLYIMFKRLLGVVIPMFIVILSLGSTFAIMAATGIPVSLSSQILPSFLVMVGVGDAVHILAVFFKKMEIVRDKRIAIAEASGHSGFPILLTSMTTAGGLLSFSSSKVAIIADLGIAGSIGVVIAFLYTILFAPVFISFFSVKHLKNKKRTGSSASMDRFLTTMCNISTGRPVTVILVFLVIITVLLSGAAKIRISHNVMKWLPETNDLRNSTETIDRYLKGTITMEVVINTGEENGIYDPQFLKKLDQAGKHVEAMELDEIYAGKVWSTSIIIKEINKALHGNQDHYYKIPDNRELVAQEFLLFENSGADDLEKMVDSQFSKARFTIKAPFEDAMKYRTFIKRIKKYLNKTFVNSEITFTGMMPLFINIIANTIDGMIKSYGIVLFIVTLLMIAMIGNLKMGLISMIPNIFPVLVVLGVMGWFKIPIDFANASIGSIIIGIAVDDTIHFFHNFRKYYEAKGDTKAAVMETMQTAGRAMATTTVVLSSSFFILMFSEIKNLYNFGFLTGTAILSALAADFLLAPALLTLMGRK